ncbi:MAG: hypothetical protein ACOYMY_04960 [Prochlorococcaceae cyanobacterium]
MKFFSTYEKAKEKLLATSNPKSTGWIERFLDVIPELLKIVSLKAGARPEDSQQLQDKDQRALEWMQRIENDDFMLEIGESLSTQRQSLMLRRTELCINHSLTTGFATWLLGTHPEFGSVLVLQLNYALEAILFEELDLYLLAPQGIEQAWSLASLWGMLMTNTLYTPRFEESLSRYLKTMPAFGGLNLSYHSPFHTMTFGHAGLLKFHLGGYDLRAKARVVNNHLWFDASRLFPTVVAETTEFTPTGRFIEIEAMEPVFHCKVGQLYRVSNTVDHRMLDLAYLATSSTYIPTVRESLELGDGVIRGLWVGLTSGKRQLLNELEIVLATVEALIANDGINCVFIDGWTGSSVVLNKDEKVTDTPSGYESHTAEAEACTKAINQRWPSLMVRSLVGLPYEYKVATGLLCKFSLTSAYTSSVIPSRVCSLPGVIHSSRVGREVMNMHIWRHSEFVPDELITDRLVPEANINPLDADYLIDISCYSQWLNRLIAQTGFRRS